MSEARITISGPIVLDGSEVDYCYPYTTLADVQNQLEWSKPYDTVRVIINSPGGRVDEGFAMYDLLRSLEGVTVITEAIGQCSSIATAAFLAGSVREVHPHCTSLVHLPTGGIIGANAEEAAAWAASLASDEARLLALYAERAGIDVATFPDVMRAETTLTAEQLLSYGFATQIVQPATALALPPKATAPTSADDSTQPAPHWAKNLMTTIKQGLAGLTAAMTSLRTPTTNQAPEVEAATALDVTTDGGATLSIDTGDRDAYQVGDTVTDADGNAAADADYVLTDGNTITVAAGAITVITPATTDSAEADDTTKQLLTAVTALATEMKSMKQQLATQAKVVNRVATAGGSNATASRAQAANDEGKDADADPAKTASDKRAARRANRYK